MNENTPVIFEGLPKEEQLALRKSFAKDTKEGKALIIAAIIMAVAAVTSATVTLVTKHYETAYTTPFPTFFIFILIGVREGKFSQWLESEKGIIRKGDLKKKERKAKKAK